MTLFFTAVDPEGKARNFTCSCGDITVALNVLSAISMLGDLFINVELIENNKRIRLPAEAINRTRFSTPDHQLENEWQQVFNS